MHSGVMGRRGVVRSGVLSVSCLPLDDHSSVLIYDAAALADVSQDSEQLASPATAMKPPQATSHRPTVCCLRTPPATRKMLLLLN